MSNSVRPHRRQPTRLPRPWDSPGKSTGVGCHFLLQCMKVKSESESEVAQSCLTPSDPMDCSPPGSSVHGILQARVLEWGGITTPQIQGTRWADEGNGTNICRVPLKGCPHHGPRVILRACALNSLNRIFLICEIRCWTRCPLKLLPAITSHDSSRLSRRP